MPSGISIADLFASLDLDDSGFDSKLANAKIGLVTAANDMALPVGKVNDLLKQLTSQIGPTAAVEGMRQLTAAGNTAYESVRQLVAGIDQLNAVEKAHSQAIKDDTALEEHRAAQRKAVNDQIMQFDQDLANAEKVQASAAADAVSKTAAAYAAQITQMRQMGTVMTDFGFIGAAVFTPIVAGLGLSAKAFADFDAALTHSLSIMGDVSSALREQLSSAALELSTKFDFSAKEIAASIYSIGSAGYNAQQALAILPITTKFAAAAFTDLDTATKLLTSSQSALGLRSEDTATNLANMTRIGDVLVKADTLAAGTSKQFAEALYNVGSTMRQLNVPLETGVAALAVFARQGITGAEAGTQLGIVMRDLATKAITHAAAWEKLNVDVYDSEGNFNDMAKILSQLQDHFKGASAEQVRYDLIQSGIQQRSQRFILTLLGMGDAMVKFESSLHSAGGTMDQIAAKNLDTFNKQWALLQHQIEAVMITLGDPLIAVFKDLLNIVTPGTKTIADFAQGFHNLPGPIQATIAAIAIGTAGLGEFTSAGLLMSGQLLRMAADIKNLGGTTVVITEVTTALKALAAVLALPAFTVGLGVVAGVAGTAAIKNATKDAQVKAAAGTATPSEGFGMQGAEDAVRQSVENNKVMLDGLNKIGAALDKARDSQRGLTLATGSTKDEFIRLGSAASGWSVAQQTALDNLLKETSANKLNLDAINEKYVLAKKARQDDVISESQYQAVLAGLDKERRASIASVTSANKVAFADQNADFKAQAQVINDAVTTQSRYTAELKTFGVAIGENKIGELIQKMADLKVGLDSGVVSQEHYDAALRQFHDMTSLTVADMDKISTEADILGNKIQAAANKQLWSDMKTGAGDAASALSPLGDAAQKSLTALIGLRSEPKNVTDAFKDLGLKSTVQLDEIADKAQKDFDIIRSSGVAAPQDIQRAWVKLMEAQINAGAKVSAGQMLLIAEVEEASKSASNKVLDLAKSVSRELTHLVDNMANTFVNGLASLFDNSANNKLDEQIRSLTSDMEAHTAAWQKAQTDAAAAIQKINDDLAANIQDLQSKSADALAKETASYNQFVSDTNAKISSVVATHQAEMAKEVAAVNDGLRKQLEDYQQFVANVGDQMRQLVSDHAASQAQIRDDAAKSLRDQTTDYQRFVEDTNTAIKAAQAQGDTTQVASLELALKRRTEDYNTFQADLAEKTAQQLADDRKAQAQAQKDLEKSLADKKKALDDAQQAAIQQIADITKTQQAAQAQELKDLHDSLVQKSAEFEDFKKQNALDLASAIKTAQDKAAADVKAQQDALAQQKADFEAYMVDYKAKLADLQAQHKTVFDKIGDMFKAMLSGFATELGKFIASSLLKSLLTSLRDKIVGTFSLPDIPGMPGTGTSPVNLPTDIPPGGDVSLPGGVPSTGGGSSTIPDTSGAGGAASSATSTLSTLSSVANIAGAVAAIGAGITNGLQMAHLISTEGKVEVNTRQSFIALDYISKRIDGFVMPVLGGYLVDIWGAILEGNQILRDISAHGGTGGGGPITNVSGEPAPLTAEQYDQKTQDLVNLLTPTPASTEYSGTTSNMPGELYGGSSTPVDAVTDNTSTVADNTTAVSALNQTLQGAAPNPLGVIPGSQEDLRNQMTALTNSAPLSPSGELTLGGSALGSDAAKAQMAAIMNLAPVAGSPGFTAGGSINGPATTGTVNMDALQNYLGGNGQGRTGFDNLSSTFQYQQYAQPYGPQGPGMGGPVTVNLNVPNPDGDVVAANFISAVEQRGVRLR